MKFVCERCHTRYSIADEKVRQKILKIRCKTCENVITVRDPAAAGDQAVSGPPPPPSRGPPAGMAAAREWFVATNGEQVGPMTRADAARRIVQSKEEDEVYVWKEGLDGWKPPSEVPAIHHEVNALRIRASAPLSRLPVPAPPRAPARKSPLRSGPSSPAAGVASKPGAAAVSMGGKGHSSRAAPAGRGSLPAAASLADNDSYAEDENTQIQPFDAALFAPDGFARAPAPGSGSVLPFTTPARDERARNGAVASIPPPAALEGLFSDLTPAPAPGGGVVGPARSTQSLSIGLSQFTNRRGSVGKFIAAGAVVAVLIALVVVVLASRPSGTEVAAPLPSEPSPAKPAPGQATREGLQAERQASASVPAPGAPTSLRDVHRAARSQPPKGAHPAPSLAPPSLEPAPLSPDEAAGPRRGAAERRVPEMRSKGPAAGAGSDGPTEAMIIAVVKKNQSTIKSCYERALKRDDRLRSGRIDVTAELGSSGTVKSVSLTAPPEFATVEACIKMAVRRWAFPTAPHEYRAEFPLIMQGNL
jgi:predicted Zn finger-like uncharacterized protein